MNKNFNLLLAIVLFTAAGCIKTTKVAPVILPEGNFTGTFRRLHLNQSNNKIDTLNANLSLSLSAATGFAVAGDTTKHAGSKGTYIVDPNYMQFIDSTYPATGKPTKIHLSGLYQYLYDGKSLKINFSNDTLNLYYSFTAN